MSRNAIRPLFMIRAVNAVTMVLLGLAYSSAHAGVTNDVPSCYKANKVGMAQAAPERELFVVVDQTTLLDEKLKRSVLENVWGFLGPNTAFTVVSFSAFSQGRYTEVVSSGRIEAPISGKERDAISEKLLKGFDACMSSQLSWAKKHAAEAVQKSMANASTQLAKSDILAALKDLSSRVKASPAGEKVVFLVSDMLENSSVSSFYAPGNRVRKIDPAKELTHAEKAGMVSDFGSAKVHVLGAGLVPPASDTHDISASYRDAQTMTALNEFWAAYLKKSNATLEQFGAPALLKPVQ
jgi:hypothetical protein